MATIHHPTPKQRFIGNPTWVNQHRELIVSDPFMRAADYAMLQYQILLANQNTDGNQAMACGFKLQGALEFLQTMRLLAELPKPTVAAPPEQLNHKV